MSKTKIKHNIKTELKTDPLMEVTSSLRYIYVDYNEKKKRNKVIRLKKPLAQTGQINKKKV